MFFHRHEVQNQPERRMDHAISRISGIEAFVAESELFRPSDLLGRCAGTASQPAR
jgi:hypothetical protein